MNMQDDTVTAPAAVLAAQPAWARTVTINTEPDGSLNVLYWRDLGAIDLGMSANYASGTVTVDAPTPAVFLEDWPDGPLSSAKLDRLARSAAQAAQIMRTVEATL